jgi:dipeptidyl aminopeptidase/acylaminoacyl peptidase
MQPTSREGPAVDERSLHALLEHAAQAEPPLGRLVDNSMCAGRRLRRRRQVLGTLACAAVVAAVVLVPAAYFSTGTGGHGLHRGAATDALAPTTAYVLTTAGNLVPVNLATSKAGPPVYRFRQGGGGVTQLAVSPNGRTAYVTTDGGAILPISAGTGRVGRPIAVPSLPHLADTLVITPDGKTALAVEGTRGVTPVDLATGIAGRQIKLPSATSAREDIAVTPNGRTAYVIGPAASGVRRVVVTPIDIATGSAGTPIILSGRGTPDGIAVSPDSRSAYVVTDTDSGLTTVTRVDTTTDTAKRLITVPRGPGGTSGIAVAPDGQTVYLLCGPEVIPISTATNAALKPIEIPIWAVGTDITIDPAGTTAYVLSALSATVTPIDLSHGTARPPITFPQPDGLEFVVLSRDGSTAYIGLSGSNTLVPLRTATGKLGTAVRLAGAPAAMVLGS